MMNVNICKYFQTSDGPMTTSLAQRAIPQRRIVMFRKCSVFIDTKLRKEIEQHPVIRVGRVFSRALQFPTTLTLHAFNSSPKHLFEDMEELKYTTEEMQQTLFNAVHKAERIESTLFCVNRHKLEARDYGILVVTRCFWREMKNGVRVPRSLGFEIDFIFKSKSRTHQYQARL
jgi:hypothetical protein